MENKAIFITVSILFLVVVGMFFVMNDSLQSLISGLNNDVPEIPPLEKVSQPETEEDQIFMLSHSEYWTGEEGQILARLLDYQGTPITDANCTVDVLYPDRSYFLQDAQAIYNVESYSYNFTTPAIEGVYEYKVNCVYQNGAKERSTMNSFHVSPALNFLRLSHDNLSNQIANLTDLENAHFEEITLNLTDIRQDTQYIRSNMATSSEVQTIRNEVVDKLDSIANFCGDNYTSASLLCQWVNETMNRVEDIEEDIIQINESIEVVINNTETIIDNTELIINQTQQIINFSEGIVEQINITVGDLIDESLEDIRTNISDMQNDLEIIKNNTNVTITLLEEQLQTMLQNFSDLRNDISAIQNDTFNNFTSRFDNLDTQIGEIQAEVIRIENKLDCNNTINTVCDKLDEIIVDIVQVNVTSNEIQEYLEGLVTEYLVNITNQTSGAGDFLFKGVPEIDLFIDDMFGDYSRAGGTVDFDVELVRPVVSDGYLQLYINNVLKANSSDPLSYSEFMSEGTYTIKARFSGDGNYSFTTEYAVLTITSTNNIPTASLSLPAENESVDLPYNITFTVTDDNNDNVSLFLYSGGVLNTTIVTDLENTDTSYNWATTTPSGYYDLVLLVCELGTTDLYCVNDSHYIYLNDSCVPVWSEQYDSCLINNSRFKTYIDNSSCDTSEGLPLDNGTYEYCDYCEPDLSDVFLEPEVCPANGTQYRYYIDYNYASCCSVTGFVSDCPTDYSPYINTTINCSVLESDITLLLDSEPYLDEKIHVLADLNMSNATKCWTYVKSENGLLQSNPRKVEYSDSLIFSKKTESREYFEPVMGQINGYYTDENLVAYKQFILGMSCALDNGTVISGERYVTPRYKDLKTVNARGVWAVGEMEMLLIVGILAIFIIGLALYAFKK